MTFHVWCPDRGEDRSDAYSDDLACDGEEAAERDAKRRFDYTGPFESVNLMVAAGSGPPRAFEVAVELRRVFGARPL